MTATWEAFAQKLILMVHVYLFFHLCDYNWQLLAVCPALASCGGQ